VNLVEHEITEDFKPTVEVTLGGVQFPRLEFDLHLSLKFEGCVLTIVDGKIVAVLPGTCQGEATLKYLDVTVAKSETKKMNLGAEIQLTKSIAIGAV
jgi:hypothetical protein